MIRFSFLTILLFFASIADAQTLGYPDSAAVVKNKVKVARIYFKSKDGKRYQQKELHYDKQGRIIIEREGEHSFYYAYVYDSQGRRISTTQRSKDGAFIQKFTEEYNESDSTRQVYLFLERDTITPSYIYTYDSRGRKIREEQYSPNGHPNIYEMTYDQKGDVIASYDSIGSERMASFRKNGMLVKRRVYSPKGELLREYRYTYTTSGKIKTITDSSSLKNVVQYDILYNDFGAITEYQRSKKKMPEQEVADFRKEFYYVFPFRDEEEMPYGLPVPELINEHHFTYDKKGNIIRDDLVQKQGSYSETYVYEYEYEFY